VLCSSELTNVNFLVSSTDAVDNEIDPTTAQPMNECDVPLSNLQVESTADDVEGEEEDDDETCKTSANESRKFCVHFSQSWMSFHFLFRLSGFHRETAEKHQKMSFYFKIILLDVV
jgi:hypothetical protein